MIVVPGWKIFNIPPSSNIIHDTVLYYGMWCLLPNEWCINQGSGYLILLFFYQLFSVDAMRFIFMNIVLLIYWTFYINQPMICYFCVCYLGGIVGDVYVANFFNYCVYTPVIATCMEHNEDRIFLSFGIYSGNIQYT